MWVLLQGLNQGNWGEDPENNKYTWDFVSKQYGKRALGKQSGKWSDNTTVIFILIIWFEVIHVRFKWVTYKVAVIDLWIS